MRSRILRALALLFIALPALAAPEQPHYSARITAGGLTCFTVTPGDPSKDAPKFKTCDELCADRASACTGVTSSINPPLSCANAASMMSCRCCAVAK